MNNFIIIQKSDNYYQKIFEDGTKVRVSKIAYLNQKKTPVHCFDNFQQMTVQKGVDLYMGSSEQTNACPDIFGYEGISQHEFNNILYLTTNEQAAEGYARCFGVKQGWVKKYTVIDSFEVSNISEDQLHYDGDEVELTFCDCNGYYLEWDPSNIEIVVCNPSEFLKYKGSKQCLGKGRFSSYGCVP